MKEEKLDRTELLKFLKEIDNDFPTSLSDKVNLNEYVDKILDKAEIIVKRENDEIAGITVFYCNDPSKETAYAVLTGVRSQYRGRGIATFLKREQIKKVKELGFKKLLFYTENPVAQKLYENLGGKVIESSVSGRVLMEIKFK